MKKFLSRSIAVFLLAFFSYSLCVPASASVYSSEYLNRYSGSITAQGGGEIKISFSVAGMKQLDELGASEIVVEKKVGSSWTEVKTYTNDDYPEPMPSITPIMFFIREWLAPNTVQKLQSLETRITGQSPQYQSGQPDCRRRVKQTSN